MNAKTVSRAALIALLTMPLLAACGKGKDAGMSAPPPQTSTPPATSSPAMPPPSTTAPPAGAPSSTAPSSTAPSSSTEQGSSAPR